ncbi:MAG: universal stress protein [Actinobacteria bacterium]|nr:universal stress protein [Actinomycetota bacterium]
MKMRSGLTSDVGTMSVATEDRQSRPATSERVRRVLVSYRSSSRGRAALSYAVDLAHDLGVPLTVVSVVPEEPTDVGCARCRQSAVIWNREMRSLAAEELREAAGLVRPGATVDYVAAVGRPAEALGRAAERSDADLIVLPWEPGGRIRRLFSRTVAEGLRESGRWRVIVARAAPGRNGAPVEVSP